MDDCGYRWIAGGGVVYVLWGLLPWDYREVCGREGQERDLAGVVQKEDGTR